MNLYDKKGNKIVVYSMQPNKKKIYEFKKWQIQTIPIEKRILKAVTNSTPVFQIYDNYASVKESEVYNKASFLKRKYHDLVEYPATSSEMKRQNEILEVYYNKITSPFRINKVISDNEINKKLEIIHYLLITERYFHDNRASKKKTMNNIISLTKDLYLLEMLLNNKTYFINKEDISKQIELFDFNPEPIDIIDMDVVRNEKLRLIYPEESVLLNKVNQSYKILKYVKK